MVADLSSLETGLVNNVLIAIVMDHCNGIPTPTSIEAPLVIYDNYPEAKID